MLKRFIEQLYYILWHDVFRGDEPWTKGMRRNAKKNWVWWLLIPIVLSGGWYALIFHLGGFW